MVAALDLKSIRNIDTVLHERSRLSIVFALCSRQELSFAELKSLLGMTDGNLSIHLRTLEESGYLDTTRTRTAGKSRKLCRLSSHGRKAFEDYLEMLGQIVRAVRHGSYEGTGGADGHTPARH